MAISNTFEVLAQWVSQNSYYSVILQPTVVKLQHVIVHPKEAEQHIKNNLAISIL